VASSPNVESGNAAGANGDIVVIHDVSSPAAARRGMAFADAMFDGSCELEGLVAYRIDDLSSPPRFSDLLW
jgi:hypothetical protein